MNVYKDLMQGLQEVLQYVQGDTTVGRSVNLVNTHYDDVITDEDIKLHIKEPLVTESFENITFNPLDRWEFIYETVIDTLVEKYWFTKDRKHNIESKVKEFYETFKNYESVRKAYSNFLKSDRLFEDF